MTADVPMPTSLALSRMNMSLELPIANSRAPAGSDRLKAERRGCSRCSRTKSMIASTLSSPGTTAIAKIQRSETCACTSARATSGPSTAPSVSMLRCRPNANPCCAGRVRGDEVVARRRAHALAETVGEAAGQRQRPAGRQRDHQLAEAAEGVAGEHEGSSPAGVVGGLPERVLGDAGRRFRDALDHAEQRHRDTEYRRDEDREQRVGDL